MFRPGIEARDGGDRVIYNRADGHLYYDGDGYAAGGATLIGIFANRPTLTAADFVVA